MLCYLQPGYLRIQESGSEQDQFPGFWRIQDSGIPCPGWRFSARFSMPRLCIHSTHTWLGVLSYKVSPQIRLCVIRDQMVIAAHDRCFVAQQYCCKYTSWSSGETALRISPAADRLSAKLLRRGAHRPRVSRPASRIPPHASHA